MQAVNKMENNSILTNNKINQTAKKQVKSLGKEEFLKILVTQLSHQDPLQPMEDKEFIAQMAQFSALEQMMSMNKSMTKMSQTQDLNKAFIFLGRNVKVYDEIDDKMITGKVTEIDLTDPVHPGLKINNKVYGLDKVRGIIMNEGNNLNPDKNDKK